MPFIWVGQSLDKELIANIYSVAIDVNKENTIPIKYPDVNFHEYIRKWIFTVDSGDLDIYTNHEKKQEIYNQDNIQIEM